MMSKDERLFNNVEYVNNQSFLEEFSKFLICSICSGVIMNPRECSECKSNYCKECIIQWMKTNSCCANKCVKPQFTLSSRLLNSLLDKIEFNCARCSNITKYKFYYKHCFKEHCAERVKTEYDHKECYQNTIGDLKQELYNLQNKNIKLAKLISQNNSEVKKCKRIIEELDKRVNPNKEKIQINPDDVNYCDINKII